MTDITSSKSKMQNEEVRNDAAVSQASQTRFGANVNHLIDQTDNHGPRITTNEGDIAQNTSDIGTNTTNIATNAANIITNANNITTNATNISTNTGDITTLEGGFGSVATHVPSLTQSPSGSTSESAYTGSGPTTKTERYIFQHGGMYWVQLYVVAVQKMTSYPNHYFTLPATPDTGVMVTTGVPFSLAGFITSVSGGNHNVFWDPTQSPLITNGKIRINADDFGVTDGSTYNIYLNMMFKST